MMDIKNTSCILLEFIDSSIPLKLTALKPTQSENSGESLILWSVFELEGLTTLLLATSAASSSSLTSPSSPLLWPLGSFFP